MKNMGFRRSLIAIGLIAAVVMAGSGCESRKLYSDPDMTADSSVQTTIDPLSFAAIDAKMREYNFGINEFMKDHYDQAVVKTSTGITLGGVPASCKYMKSNDGKYESLQMEKDIGNGVQVDEYFNMGDALFIARTTLYDDGNYDPVIKYYITDGVLYQVDGSAETVTKIVDLSDPSAGEKQANIDIYFTFDEIRAIYA